MSDSEIQKAVRFLGELMNEGTSAFSQITIEKMIEVQKLILVLASQRSALQDLIDSHTTDLTKLRISLIQNTKDIL